MTSTSSSSWSLPTQDMVQYDFEEYALEHGIPETLDPLPYRKAGSVFATGEEAEPVMTSAKHDPRLRTVVCRHWLRDLCMKGAACEFLHQYDLSKMPLCRHGDRCKVKDCPFRHISEADRLECVFYSQGFCIHGPFCRYKHLRRDRVDLPAVADFTLGLSQMQAGKDGVQQRRPAPKPNEFYKVSLCKHFLQGECPFGDGCHFAHGESELKKFPRNRNSGGPGNEEDDKTAGGGAELSDNMFGNQETTTVDYFRGGSSGGGKPSPILEPEHASFFIVRAASHRDLAISTVRSEWWVQARHAEKLNTAWDQKIADKNKTLLLPYNQQQRQQQQQQFGQVMIFFTVSDSNHIQGAALMTSRAKCRIQSENMSTNSDATASASEAADAAASEADVFTHCFQCEWYRTAELPIKTAVEAAPDLILPTKATQFCEDMSWRTGESVMKALWNAPLATLYEAWTGPTNDDDEQELPPPADDAILTDFRAPKPNEICWPTMPKPGFIFGCNSQTMDECLGRGIFGLPAHMRGAAAGIAPGSSIFLFNVTDRLLFGIFEALTPATLNIDPAAFSKIPNSKSSPFPVQIRVQVSLECPPVQDDEHHTYLNNILRSRIGGRIGPLTHAQTQALCNLLSSQCGALHFMAEYAKAKKEGRVVQPPPIALPPRKVTPAAAAAAGTGGAPTTVNVVGPPVVGVGGGGPPPPPGQAQLPPGMLQQPQQQQQQQMMLPPPPPPGVVGPPPPGTPMTTTATTTAT